MIPTFAVATLFGPSFVAVLVVGRFTYGFLRWLPHACCSHRFVPDCGFDLICRGFHLPTVTWISRCLPIFCVVAAHVTTCSCPVVEPTSARYVVPATPHGTFPHHTYTVHTYLPTFLPISDLPADHPTRVPHYHVTVTIYPTHHTYLVTLHCTYVTHSICWHLLLLTCCCYHLPLPLPATVDDCYVGDSLRLHTHSIYNFVGGDRC